MKTGIVLRIWNATAFLAPARVSSLVIIAPKYFLHTLELCHLWLCGGRWKEKWMQASGAVQFILSNLILQLEVKICIFFLTGQCFFLNWGQMRFSAKCLGFWPWVDVFFLARRLADLSFLCVDGSGESWVRVKVDSWAARPSPDILAVGGWPQLFCLKTLLLCNPWTAVAWTHLDPTLFIERITQTQAINAASWLKILESRFLRDHFQNDYVIYWQDRAKYMNQRLAMENVYC